MASMEVPWALAATISDTFGPAPGSSSAPAGTELIDARTAMLKTFVGDSPGELRTEFHSTAIHFTDTKGAWVDLDTDLGPSENGRRRQVSNTLDVSVADSAADAALVDVVLDAAHSVGFSLEGAAKVKGEADRKSVIYIKVRKDTDVVITSRANGIKEELVLASPAAPDRFVFPLKLRGLTASIDDAGDVVYRDEAGAERARTPHGFMTDSNIDPLSNSAAVVARRRLRPDPARQRHCPQGPTGPGLARSPGQALSSRGGSPARHRRPGRRHLRDELGPERQLLREHPQGRNLQRRLRHRPGPSCTSTPAPSTTPPSLTPSGTWPSGGSPAVQPQSRRPARGRGLWCWRRRGLGSSCSAFLRTGARFRVGKMAVDRCPADAQDLGDSLDRVLLGVVHLAGGGHLVGGHDRRAPAVATPCLSRHQAGLCPFSDELRSNSARAPKMWNTSSPPQVVVSMFSVRLRNPTLRSDSAFTVSMRWLSERPRRSRRHTTTVSPGCLPG